MLQFTPYAVVENIVTSNKDATREVETRTLSIFFCDIESFTTISEHMEPEQLLLLLSDFLETITFIIEKNKGTIDKFIGDSVMAFWNAPLDTPDHSRLAVLSAVEVWFDICFNIFFSWSLVDSLNMRVESSGLSNWIRNFQNFNLSNVFACFLASFCCFLVSPSFTSIKFVVDVSEPQFSRSKHANWFVRRYF